MKNYVEFFTGNYVLNIAIACWFAAQMIKIIIDAFKTHRFHPALIISSGGMPSSHTSTVVGTAVAVGKVAGLQSVAFAIAVILAIIVMYDASGVRQETGKQAKILNYMMDNWRDIPPAMFQQNLKELVGHTPFEVLAGAALGLSMGLVF